ncbi:hypothetical protein Taro_043993 [Colocasia esculenta]|uniref:Uncharacterized protein n=1 Tax=Colocasia esculenta TaxID=4460 RepID=A0A843WKR9_COLES|nr:hypothetical protein [Colocasia esculenta]
MDLWALKSGGGGGGVAAPGGASWGLGRKRVFALRQSASWRRVCGDDGSGVFGWRVLEMGVSGRSGRRNLGCRYLEVRASGKNKGQESSPSHGSNDPSIPEGDGSGGSNSISGETKSEESLTQKSPHLNLDWRTFRANLVAQEKVLGHCPLSPLLSMDGIVGSACSTRAGSDPADPDLSRVNKGQAEDSNKPSEEAVHEKPSNAAGSKWAHPIPVPESGCVLIATDKLDGVHNFERTVVLLLRIGTRDYREGPFGVILNRPLHKKIKQMKPTNSDLATTFADCSLHFGGPLDASIFLVRTNESSPPPSFEQVVPGICVGARNSLDEAAGLVKKGMCHPRDFRFFVGYAGWQLDQLRDEIESGYWIVAACSSDLIGSAALESSSCLWEETLQLMGGQYSELSRKARASVPPS